MDDASSMRRLMLGATAATLALVVAALALAPAAGQARAGKSPVTARNYEFGPKTIRISKGEKVSWKLVEGRHTVTQKGGGFDQVLTGGDPRFSQKFKHAGTFKYYCRFDRALGMKGKVVVK